MDILIFIVVLVVLIVVHEFGHFLVAKWAGMKVEEFGIGYPPRAASFRRGETEYSLNWLPFGGFVKIYGEDAESELQASSFKLQDGQGTTKNQEDNKLTANSSQLTARAFSEKPRILQALVLIAGIAMNLVFAWVLISITLAIGLPRALSLEEAARSSDAALVVVDVLPGSPAERAGVLSGDKILEANLAENHFTDYTPDAFTNFVSNAAKGTPVHLSLTRGKETLVISVEPEAGIVTSDPARLALGVAVATVGTLYVPWWRAPLDGAVFTWHIVTQISVGLYHFFGGLFTFSADLSQISGPIGIVGAVGQASAGGLVALLILTAVISINLALINLIPVPALDGGRLLFVAIEAVLNRPLPRGFAVAANTIGFALLILLMLVVTASDIWKIVG